MKFAYKLLMAPMQDVTDINIWRLLSRKYSVPELFVTEYIRVYPHSILDKRIANEILINDTGVPIAAQVAGEDIPSLIKICTGLQRLPVAAIDLNLGCPAQIVCRKNVGGALLKDLGKVKQILEILRETIACPFTVKCRLGYADDSHFEELLDIFRQYNVDAVSIHGRTVKQGYSGCVNWDKIFKATTLLPCPVIGNGDIIDPKEASDLLKNTQIKGVMLGRGAIRNPWIFDQIRCCLDGHPVSLPTGRDILAYLYDLLEVTGNTKHLNEMGHLQRLKKFLNFIGEGIDAEKQFLHQVRRATTYKLMEKIWKNFLDHDRPMSLI